MFAAAWSEGQVVVTHDADFLDNRRFPPHRNPGVILIRPGADGRDDQGRIRCLAKALRIAGDNDSWSQGKKYVTPKLVFEDWLPGMDSNHDSRLQRPLSYH